MNPDDRQHTLTIRTPEGISFSLHLATPLLRFFAWATDVACVAVVFLTIRAIISVLSPLSMDFSFALSAIAYFAVSFGYAIALEWKWRGQTIGKRLMKLRVVDRDGLQLQFSQIVIRNLLRAVDRLPSLYLVGGLMASFNHLGQRLGDLAANTVVIRVPSIEKPDVVQILGGKYNSFRNYPHLQARLRQNTSADEASLAFQSLLRRDEFDDDARVALYAQFADHFRQLADFPEEVEVGLTEEQYVRNVVDSLYNTTRQG